MGLHSFFSVFFFFCVFFFTKGYWFQQNPVCFMLQTLTLNYEYIACLHVLVVSLFFFLLYSPNSLGLSRVMKMHIHAFKLFEPCRLLRLQVIYMTTDRETPPFPS